MGLRKEQINAAVGILVIVFVFLIVSYLVQNNIEEMRSLIGAGFMGMFVYLLILIISIVVAPVASLPLLPVASGIWGWFIAGLLSIIGWGIGALIAFGLSRKYGVPLIKKFVSLEEIGKYEKMIPEENIFWSIVFLRMALPVDILSYVLGLLSHIRFRTYAIATFIGIIPGAFILAYAGTLPFRYQVMAFIIGVIIILTSLKIRKIYKLKKVLKKKAKDLENLIDTDKLNILKTDVLIKETKKLRKK